MDWKWNNLTSNFAWKSRDYQFTGFYHVSCCSCSMCLLSFFPMDPQPFARLSVSFHSPLFFLTSRLQLTTDCFSCLILRLPSTWTLRVRLILRVSLYITTKQQSLHLHWAGFDRCMRSTLEPLNLASIGGANAREHFRSVSFVSETRVSGFYESFSGRRKALGLLSCDIKSSSALAFVT